VQCWEAAYQQSTAAGATLRCSSELRFSCCRCFSMHMEVLLHAFSDVASLHQDASMQNLERMQEHLNCELCKPRLH
jgi:hypothetical protein